MVRVAYAAKRRLLLLTLWMGALGALPFSMMAQRPVVERLGDWLPEGTALHSTMQGMALYGRYAIALRDSGQCLILDLRKQRCVGNYFLDQNTTHCNNACFASTKRYGDSPFPLLYVSSCYGDKACLVTKIGFDTSEVVQRIFFDSDRFRIAQDWCADADSGYLYAFGGKRGGTMYLLKFKLPEVDRCEVHLTEADILQTTPINCVDVAQGSKIKGGYAYLPDGNKPGGYFLHVVELGTGREVEKIDLNPLGMEPEGVDIKRGRLYVSFHTEKGEDNCIYKFPLPR